MKVTKISIRYVSSEDLLRGLVLQCAFAEYCQNIIAETQKRVAGLRITIGGNSQSVPVQVFLKYLRLQNLINFCGFFYF